MLALDNANPNVGFVDAKDPANVEKGEKRTYAPLKGVENPTWSKMNVPYIANGTFKATLVYPDPAHEV